MIDGKVPKDGQRARDVTLNKGENCGGKNIGLKCITYLKEIERKKFNFTMWSKIKYAEEAIMLTFKSK